MKTTPLFRRATSLASCLLLPAAYGQAHAAPASVEAQLFSTMPSTFEHRPEMAMDGDSKSYFKSFYGMADGDDFTVLFSEPIPVQSVKVVTGTSDGDDIITDGFVDVSADGANYKKAASFTTSGIAEGNLNSANVKVLRVKLNPRKGASTLLIREITIASPTKISHVQMGPGRPFTDYSQAPDLAAWASKADQQMESYWADVQAMLYTDKFITPNKVNVVYRTGPDVTPVAATGGGVMTVNSAWCRAHPEDTGLTVHEMAHAIQSMTAYNPVWLIEGVADYVRWCKFEPENYRVQINPDKATYHDSYRTTGTWLAWCEMHYDPRLVTKLNNEVRFARYKESLFKQYTGKDPDTLWAEFIADYRKDPINILKAPVPLEDRPRPLPAVTPGSSVTVSLTDAFDSVGIYQEGTPFAENAGLDGGGAAFSASLLGTTRTWKDLKFNLGPADRPNMISARGNTVGLPSGNYASLWLLATAVDGGQKAQEITINYADGSKETFLQNISDWFQPLNAPGESRAIKMPYRVTGNGARDPRTFTLYSYGFPLNPAKTVKSVTLPNNPYVKIAAVTLAG
jgi:hypothetical protein